MKQLIILSILTIGLIIPISVHAVRLPEDTAFQLRAELLQKINDSRAKDSQSLLQYNTDLERVAQKHANDTADTFIPDDTKSREASYLAHISSDGKTLEDRFSDSDVPTGWGFSENTGYWTRIPFGNLMDATRFGLKLMHEGMMAEVPPNDAHKQNILGHYTHVGIGLSLLEEPGTARNVLFMVTNFSRYTSQNEEIKLREVMEHQAMSPRSLFHAAAIPNHGGPFLDVRPNHPYAKSIEDMQIRSIIQGYPDGTFKPEGNVSRAELTKMIMDAIKENPIGREFEQCFRDVFNQWFGPYVCVAKRNGWITGYSDNTFRPANPVSRAEGITLIARIMKLKEDPRENIFYRDVKEDVWFVSSLRTLHGIDAIPFPSRRIFSPAKPLKRGEVAAIIHRTLEYEEEHVNNVLKIPEGTNRKIQYIYRILSSDGRTLKERWEDCNVFNDIQTGGENEEAAKATLVLMFRPHRT